MLSEYIQHVLELARYEMIEDEEPYYSEVPELRGVWATGESPEECHRNLIVALEDWLLFSIARGLPIPVFGSDVFTEKAIASKEQVRRPLAAFKSAGG